MQIPNVEQGENVRNINANSGMEFESDETDQFLTFIVAGEEYGVDILCVQEIRGWESATPIPNAPAHIKGVINLRGTIVPIIDLRQCFGIESDGATCSQSYRGSR